MRYLTSSGLQIAPRDAIERECQDFGSLGTAFCLLGQRYTNGDELSLQKLSRVTFFPLQISESCNEQKRTINDEKNSSSRATPPQIPRSVRSWEYRRPLLAQARKSFAPVPASTRRRRRQTVGLVEGPVRRGTRAAPGTVLFPARARRSFAPVFASTRRRRRQTVGLAGKLAHLETRASRDRASSRRCRVSSYHQMIQTLPSCLAIQNRSQSAVPRLCNHRSQREPCQL